MTTTAEFRAVRTAETDALRHTLRRVRLYAAVMEHSPDAGIRAVARQVRAYANPAADATGEPGRWEYEVQARFPEDPDNAWVATGRTYDAAEAVEWADNQSVNGIMQARVVSRLVTEWETV